MPLTPEMLQRLDEVCTNAAVGVRKHAEHLLNSGCIDTTEEKEYTPIKIAVAAALLNESHQWEPLSFNARKGFLRAVKNAGRF